MLFDVDYDARTLDANGDLALLVDRDQAATLRDEFAEIRWHITMTDQSKPGMSRAAAETLIDEWRIATEDERCDRDARTAYGEAAEEY